MACYGTDTDSLYAEFATALRSGNLDQAATAAFSLSKLLGSGAEKPAALNHVDLGGVFLAGAFDLIHHILDWAGETPVEYNCGAIYENL